MLETKFYKAKSQLGWRLIGGLEEVKRELVEALVWPVKYCALYKRLGMREAGGVLLYGPSGCGRFTLWLINILEGKYHQHTINYVMIFC